MESAKGKAIREAWAEHYDFVKVNLESDGSFWVYEYQTELYEWCCKNTKRIISTKKATRFIPFNIVGVHDNNGWTRIESEADLPEKNSECWAVWKLNGFITTDIFKQSDDKEYADEQRKYWMEKYSHHQPIVKPQPPIY